MSLTAVENLLADRLGFDVHSVGQKAVESTIRHCMKQAGFSEPAAYARALAHDSSVWLRLVEKTVIAETWFFRDVAPFEFAAEFARTHMRRTDRPLRILSCPCSTGEEPYSLVMTMLHSRIPVESFIVDAVDISQRAIKSALTAIFPSRSFRDYALPYRAKYFEAETGNSWRLKNSVLSLVRFRSGNLISPDFWAGERYDLIFCRNLLIYFHSDARYEAMATLRGLMARDGALVVGHAEAAFPLGEGLKPAGSAAAFAFLDREPRLATKSRFKTPAHETIKSEPRPNAHKDGAHKAPETKHRAPLTSIVPERVLHLPQEAASSLLVLARGLGDSGKLQEAVHVCGEHLRQVPDSADGHFLLGVLYDALGRGELAAQSFRKTLYLDPAHHEALLHLALKQEARGDRRAAALLRERAQRSPRKSVNE